MICGSRFSTPTGYVAPISRRTGIHVLGFLAEIPYEEGLRSVVEWRRSDERRAVPEQA
jgi:hypothetical protein